DRMALRTYQDWVVKPPLRTVSGVAEINSWGGMEKQLQVRLRPEAMLEHEVTLEQVQEALRRNNQSVGGGHLEAGGARYLVRGLARPVTVDQIKDVALAPPRDGVALRVRDVADVGVGPDLRLGSVTAQGRGEVVLGLGFMTMGENSREVTNRLRARLDETTQSAPKGVEVTPVYERTRLVEQVLDTVRRNLFEGGLLVIAVLFIFLGNLRAGLIVALAIPL